VRTLLGILSVRVSYRSGRVRGQDVSENTPERQTAMRHIIVTEFISLDGVVEAPGGEEGYKHTGWTFDIDEDPAMYEFKGEELRDVEALLLGRRTYEGFAAAWPGREGEFADRFNSMPKYVVSSTLKDPSWNNTTVVDFDDIAGLREGDGGPIQVAGSAQLAQGLHHAGLVDQWNLMVFPVILGSGKRLFPTDAEDKQKLQLVDSRTYANGVQLQVLRPA
jgi:dihydrofolate reductase